MVLFTGPLPISDTLKFPYMTHCCSDNKQVIRQVGGQLPAGFDSLFLHWLKRLIKMQGPEPKAQETPKAEDRWGSCRPRCWWVTVSSAFPPDPPWGSSPLLEVILTSSPASTPPHPQFPKTQEWDQGLPGSGLEELQGTVQGGWRGRRGLGFGGKRVTPRGDLGWGISTGHSSESLAVSSSLCSDLAASRLQRA